MIAIFLSGLLARPASACLTEASDPAFFPADGAVAVAISAQPVVRYGAFNTDGPPPTLATADGSPISVTVEERVEEAGAEVVILRPDEPLQPATVYVLTAVTHSGAALTASFTTGEVADKDAPA